MVERYFAYLDQLRESGETNMLGARPYLMKAFGLTKEEAGKALEEWIKSRGGRLSPL